MNIHWYPGHMAKAIREMQANMKLYDCIILVLDARAPKSCLNEDFLLDLGAKPVLFAINKIDLADKKAVSAWVREMGEGRQCVLLNSTVSGAGKAVNAAINSLCREKIEKFKAKGMRATLRALVVGVPNSGKSTLINALCGQGKARTGNTPGVTRGLQWVRAGQNLEVQDMPGTLPPKMNDQNAALNLALIGCVPSDILSAEDLAVQLIAKLNQIDEEILRARFGEKITMVEQAAVKRGWLLRGGVADIERASLALLDDFRKGRLGAITLDDLSKQ